MVDRSSLINMAKIKPIKTAYRVEHIKDKYEKYFAGPYGDSGDALWADKLTNGHYCMKKYPNPFYDKLLKLTFPMITLSMRKHICGFKSMKQLEAWFSSTEIRKLLKIDFAIVSYEVKIVVDGHKSLMFIPRGERTIIKQAKKKSKSKILKAS